MFDDEPLGLNDGLPLIVDHRTFLR
jgi:hypothetical protein